MSKRAEALAKHFEEANADLVAFIENCPDAAWTARCPAEGWTVAAASHHIAIDHPLLADLARRVVTGEAMPALDMGMVDEMNAQHAEEFARCATGETLNLLRTNGGETANFIRGLSDADLDRTAAIPWWGSTPVSAERVVEELIHHIPEHLNSMREALASVAEARPAARQA